MKHKITIYGDDIDELMDWFKTPECLEELFDIEISCGDGFF